MDGWWEKFVIDQQRKAGRAVTSSMVGPTEIADTAIPFYGALPQDAAE